MLRSHDLRTTAAITFALGAMAAPAATAKIPAPDQPCHCCYRSAGQSSAGSKSARPAIVHIDSRGGFDWPDAAIGAAGGIALSLVSLGGALVISHHRSHPQQVPPGHGSLSGLASHPSGAATEQQQHTHRRAR